MALYKHEATDDLPKIELNSDSGSLLFEGNSIPKDAFPVYLPVIEWIDDYLNCPKKITIVDFKFKYFNTGTSKFIFEIMQRLLVLKDRECEIKFNWHCANDVDIIGIGKRYMDLLDYEINIIIE